MRCRITLDGIVHSLAIKPAPTQAKRPCCVLTCQGSPITALVLQVWFDNMSHLRTSLSRLPGAAQALFNPAEAVTLRSRFASSFSQVRCSVQALSVCGIVVAPAEDILTLVCIETTIYESQYMPHDRCRLLAAHNPAETVCRCHSWTALRNLRLVPRRSFGMGSHASDNDPETLERWVTLHPVNHP